MQPLIILHTNDIHGRVEGLARVATLVDRIRAENSDIPVLYFDLGDCEDTSSRLSNLTKGTAMHRLLTVAGCDAAAVGNAAWLRYGPQVLREHAEAARYPLLLANLRAADGSLMPGIQPTATLDLGRLRLGLVGVTAEMNNWARFFDMKAQPALPLIRELSAALRQDGADAVILLSHMGLETDRELAAGLQEDIALIIGAHSHDLLPEGERVGRVLIAQAGDYAEHLGRLDVTWDGEQLAVSNATVLSVPDDVAPAARTLAEADVIEGEVEHFLDETIGELVEPLSFATDRECGVANLMADVLRERMDADVAVVVAGQAFSGPLPAGPLRRVTLWDVCASSANPGVVTLTGTQLTALLERGLDAELAAERPHSLRGGARGLMHLSGAAVRAGQILVDGKPLEPDREYRVAGSDFEFEPFWGYADADWDLHPGYEVPTILREALEDYLASHSPVRVELGRLHGTGWVVEGSRLEARPSRAAGERTAPNSRSEGPVGVS
ncbi:MAG: bifunctional metallophosphatase/5'-nucleotidase [Anaerolineae bacterium]